MYGPTLFLVTFILVVPRYRELVDTLVNRAGGRIAAESPISYFVLMVVALAAMVCCVMMALWPRVKDPNGGPALRRFFGRPGQTRIEFRRSYLSDFYSTH